MIRKLRRDVSEIKTLVNSINTALIVREPGTALAAEAYEGLRRQVSQATAERRAHLVELVRLHEAIDNGVSGEALRRMVEGWADQAGLRRWNTLEPAEFFEVIGDSDGLLEIVHPAWVVGDPPILIKPGLAQRSLQEEQCPAAVENDRTSEEHVEEQS